MLRIFTHDLILALLLTLKIETWFSIGLYLPDLMVGCLWSSFSFI